MACVESFVAVLRQLNCERIERIRYFCLARITVWGEAADSAQKQYKKTGIIAHKYHWEYCDEQRCKAETDLIGLQGGDPQMWDIDEW